jgi:hypothetical protein
VSRVNSEPFAEASVRRAASSTPRGVWHVTPSWCGSRIAHDSGQSFGTGDAPAFVAASEPLGETIFIGTLAAHGSLSKKR